MSDPAQTSSCPPSPAPGDRRETDVSAVDPAEGLLSPEDTIALQGTLIHAIPLSISDAQRIAFACSDDHGFHEEPANPILKLCLIHSEVTEAMEALRDPAFDHPLTVTYRKDGKPEGFGPELADVVIRCLDLAGILGIDLQRAVAEKMLFNIGRPHKHGKNF